MKLSASRLAALPLVFAVYLGEPAAGLPVAPDGATERGALRAEEGFNPQEIDALKRRVSVYLQAHRESEALAAAKLACALSPEDNEARKLYAKALVRNGKYQEALSAHGSIRPETVPSDELKPVIEAARLALEADRCIALGDAGGESRDFKDAAQQLREAIQLDPDNLALRKTLGWVLLDETCQPHAAYLHLEEVIRNHPSDVDARKLFACACRQTGRPREAIAILEKVLVPPITADDSWWWVNLGMSLARVGRFDEAGRIYDSVLAVDPQCFYARLGKAELAAWQGKLEDAEEQLGRLLNEEPENADARALLADVLRWQWRLSEARAEYRKVLDRFGQYGGAVTGLREIECLSSCSVTIRSWEFTDTTDFGRSYVQAETRVPLSDKAYLFCKGAGWEFRHPAFADLRRTDAGAALEYHWGSWLDTRLQFSYFDYANRDPFFGGGISAKYSPSPSLDVYTTCLFDYPFESSISTVYAGMHQDSLGVGMNAKVYGPWSFQGGLEMAWISDGNRWLNVKPQLSYRLTSRPESYLRLEYELLSFAERRANYWTPADWQLLKPNLDIRHAVTEWLAAEVTVAAPYVFERSQVGVQLAAGPRLELNGRLQGGAAYMYSSIPGDQGVWSGTAWQVFLSWTF
jgi:tetratricopeptide (TPR) repeat protein